MYNCIRAVIMSLFSSLFFLIHLPQNVLEAIESLNLKLATYTRFVSQCPRAFVYKSNSGTNQVQLNPVYKETGKSSEPPARRGKNDAATI